MMRHWLPALLLILAGCAPMSRSAPPPTAIALDLEVKSRGVLVATYRLPRPATALHFAQELGGYRRDNWQPLAVGGRWVTEGDGERIESKDGQTFTTIAFVVPILYQPLPKSYAPFSPFSEGSTLIHSGQFHVCLDAPCDGAGPLEITIDAPGRTIGVEGRRTPERETFTSRDEGTNIFAGTLAPIDADGFVAIFDPGLPPALRQRLADKLPAAMDYFARDYGPLGFVPELYVSIDARPRKDGNRSRQGGTLPRQIFMHFNGETMPALLASEDPRWLDFFFAHEAAHLFQQDKSGGNNGDDVEAWIHEGGADAMAALALIARGEEDRAYVAGRVEQARKLCAEGLARRPLNRATAADDFDVHYQCGLLIALAIDRELAARGSGLAAFNGAFFGAVKGGAPWNAVTFLGIAEDLGISADLRDRIARLNRGGYTDAQAELAALLPVE